MARWFGPVVCFGHWTGSTSTRRRLYVSARMCWAMESLAVSGLLPPEDRAIALEAARADRENFARGLAVVDAHGRLSATGARILESARVWMAGR